MRQPRIIRFAVTFSMLALAASPLGAAPQQQPTVQPQVNGEESATVSDGESEWRFTFGGGYTQRFSTDFDEGDGDISVSALTGGLNATTDFSDDLSLTLRVNFGAADYDFGGTSGFGALDPWNTVHGVAIGGALTYDLNDKWSVFGGPIIQFARENGADWGDSFTGGVLGGATYRVHDRLVVGGGVGVTSAIEDDLRIFPIIIVEWGFNDNWRISSRGATGGRTSIEFTGVELIWMTNSKAWEFAIGAGSSYSRFRLDDDGIAPNGVGQDESTPLWFRTSFRPNETFMIDAVAGIGFGGKVSLDDENGDGIADSDYDSPLFVGLFGSIKF